jgi:D-sedoheptulose 7-phosphate isomerase
VKVKVNTFAAKIAAELEESIQIKEKTLERQLKTLEIIGQAMLTALIAGNKVILFGNGGSAADSQHIAAEFINRFRRERRAMPAIALTTDTSVMTSIANDYSFDNIFSRQIEALGDSGDIALGISTSGNSPNVLNAFRTARQLGLITVGFTGASGGRMTDLAEICFHVPSESVSRIQEVHLTAAHALCGLMEEELISDDAK